MINEGRGISEINKIETENIFNRFKKYSFSTFEHQILNRIIEITFSIGNYDSKFYKSHGKYYILFTCPESYDDLKLKTIITHELTHFIEVSRIEDKKYTYPNYDKIKKSLMIFKPNNKQQEFFRHILYKTLDNEINSVVSQTYTYLRSFNTMNVEFLNKKLHEYSVRKEYIMLLSFDVNKFKNDIINNKINFEKFNDILIKNGVDKFLDFVKNKKDDIRYIDSWFRIIKSNIKKLLSKQENIVKEVIEDIDALNNYSTEYNVSESTILSYNEYLKIGLKD